MASGARSAIRTFSPTICAPNSDWAAGLAKVTCPASTSKAGSSISASNWVWSDLAMAHHMALSRHIQPYRCIGAQHSARAAPRTLRRDPCTTRRKSRSGTDSQAPRPRQAVAKDISFANEVTMVNSSSTIGVVPAHGESLARGGRENPKTSATSMHVLRCNRAVASVREEFEMAVTVIDITGATGTTTIDGVIFSASGPIGSGSGIYNPILNFGDNDGNESGFSSNAATDPNVDQAKTQVIPLSSIPIRYVGNTAYYEFRLDLNETNSGSQWPNFVERIQGLYFAGGILSSTRAARPSRWSIISTLSATVTHCCCLIAIREVAPTTIPSWCRSRSSAMPFSIHRIRSSISRPIWASSAIPMRRMAGLRNSIPSKPRPFRVSSSTTLTAMGPARGRAGPGRIHHLCRSRQRQQARFRRTICQDGCGRLVHAEQHSCRRQTQRSEFYHGQLHHPRSAHPRRYRRRLDFTRGRCTSRYFPPSGGCGRLGPDHWRRHWRPGVLAQRSGQLHGAAGW